jgi:prepilin-type processing-associated H-X9-DG protein
MVVIAMIAILAAMQIPALSATKLQMTATHCLDNNKKIMQAFKMYVNDNKGVFPVNPEGGFFGGWINGGEMSYSGSADNTNILDLIGPKSLLGPYVGNQPRAFKCPLDMSCTYGNHGAPRIRTYSMSAAIGYATPGAVDGQGYWLPSIYNGGPWMCYFEESHLSRPSPSKLLTLVEEDPDTINDAAWQFTMPSGAGGKNTTAWVDGPSKLHGNAGAFAFMDGHAEMHGWKNLNSIPKTTYMQTGVAPYKQINNNADVWWVGNRTSARADGTPDGFPTD